jgi:hypothetical protein
LRGAAAIPRYRPSLRKTDLAPLSGQVPAPVATPVQKAHEE